LLLAAAGCGDGDGASLLSTAALAGKPPPYAYHGKRCQNTIPTIVVDASRARAEVPAEFVLAGDPLGAAVLFLTFTSCELELNDGAPRRTVFADAGVLIVPPDGVPGLHVYWLWEITDSAALAELNRAYGVPTEVPFGLFASFESGSPFFTTSASIPWSEGAYGSSAFYLPAAPPAVPGTVTWWRQGPAGLARLDQAFEFPDTETQGIGVVTASPGGRLARLAGEQNTAEFMLTFADLSGTMRLYGRGAPLASTFRSE